MSTYTKIIEKTERVGRNSKLGNPRWGVTFTDGTYAETSRDFALGYVINNSEWLGVPIKATIRRGVLTKVEKITRFIFTSKAGEWSSLDGSTGTISRVLTEEERRVVDIEYGTPGMRYLFQSDDTDEPELHVFPEELAPA